MNCDVRVVGNLALVPESAPRLSVVNGAVSSKVVASAPCQMFAPAVYPSSSAPRLCASSTRTVVLCLAAIIVSCSLFAAFVSSFDDSTFVEAMAVHPAHVIEVDEGDSLWRIAERNAVQGLSTAETVELIRQWNGLDSGMLVPGMELSVPVSAK